MSEPLVVFLLQAVLISFYYSTANGVQCIYRPVNSTPTTCTGDYCQTIVYIYEASSEPYAVKNCKDENAFCLVRTVENHDGFRYKFFGCCTTDYCNGNLSTAGLPPEYEIITNKPLATPSAPTSGASLTVVLPSVIVAVLVCISVIGLVTAGVVCACRKWKRAGSGVLDLTIQSMSAVAEMSYSGSGAKGRFLEEATIAHQIELSHCIGRGRYGEVWRGMWYDKVVAVKKFAHCDQESWQREKDIYETNLLRHDYILCYLAADRREEECSSQLELWMITDYHPYGSLFDYLTIHTLTPAQVVLFARTTASGLAFLHAELRTNKTQKPSIAHRDLKSRNILVKTDMTCCIADFGLAVRHDTVEHLIDIAPNSKQGTKRYMAPEVLDESIDITVFTSFKQADMYSLGLVLWEMSQRCVTNDQYDEYCVPYYEKVQADPSLKEMRMVVSEQRCRPSVAVRWTTDDVLSVVVRLMKDCWNPDPNQRLTARRVMKDLENIPVKCAEISSG